LTNITRITPDMSGGQTLGKDTAAATKAAPIQFF
jgi:hypothetical protein